MTSEQIAQNVRIIWAKYIGIQNNISDEEINQFASTIEAIEVKPCEDCIRREDAIQAVTHFDDTLKRLYELPPVIPARQTERWIIHRGNYNELYECSGCHKQNREGGAFCNFCGAKMEDGE